MLLFYFLSLFFVTNSRVLWTRGRDCLRERVLAKFIGNDEQTEGSLPIVKYLKLTAKANLSDFNINLIKMLSLELS